MTKSCKRSGHMIRPSRSHGESESSSNSASTSRSSFGSIRSLAGRLKIHGQRENEPVASEPTKRYYPSVSDIKESFPAIGTDFEGMM